MSAAADRFPLAWPPGRPRMAAASRKGGQFGTRSRGMTTELKELTVQEATARLEKELDALGQVRDPILSTNMKIGVSGGILKDQAKPSDPGVALYFTLGGKPRYLYLIGCLFRGMRGTPPAGGTAGA